MNECVQRWRENRPLSAGELANMRFQAIVRTVLIVALLVLIAIALCGCKSVHAHFQGQFPSVATDQEPTFDGVTIVVAVKELTSFAPELRKKAALDADRVLRDLAERKLPGRVRTRLIAAVAEPVVFQQFEAASMHRASPVLIHVFVPAVNQRLVAAMIATRVQELAKTHFLEELQEYQLMVTFQRTMPERYSVGMHAAEQREPRPVVAPDPGFVPPMPINGDVPDSSGGLLLTMVTAWLTERSRIAAKLVHRYQRMKGRFA